MAAALLFCALTARAQINPANQIRWPICSGAASVYDIVTNTCIVNGSGSMVYPAGGVPFSTGTAWGTSYQVIGTDVNLMSAGTVVGVSAPLCTDVLLGATTFNCPSASVASQLQLQPVPPVSGQYTVIYPTNVTAINGGTGPGCSGGGSGPTGAEVSGTSSVFATNTTCGNGLTSNAWGASWGGFTLPSYVSPGAVTGVYAFSFNAFGPYYPGTSTPNVTCTATGGTPQNLFGANSYEMQQFTAFLSTATGANIGGTACTGTVNYSTAPASDTFLNLPAIGLIVYYTGSAPPATNIINLLPPLYYNPATNSLGIDPNSYVSSVNGDTGAVAAVGSVIPGGNISCSPEVGGKCVGDVTLSASGSTSNNSPMYYFLQNDSTGTSTGLLACWTTTGIHQSTVATCPASTAVNGSDMNPPIVGVCIAGCGTSGWGTFQFGGAAPWICDSAISITGYWVQPSETVAGECHQPPNGGFPGADPNENPEGNSTIGRPLVASSGAGVAASIQMLPFGAYSLGPNNSQFMLAMGAGSPFMTMAHAAQQPSTAAIPYAVTAPGFYYQMPGSSRYCFTGNLGQGVSGYDFSMDCLTQGPGVPTNAQLRENVLPYQVAQVVAANGTVTLGGNTGHFDVGNSTGEFIITLNGASTTYAPTDFNPGDPLSFTFEPPASGGPNAWTWPSGFVNAPTVSLSSASLPQTVTFKSDGTNFNCVAGCSASGGSTTHYGNSTATASAGNNSVALGSTPITGSLSLFVNGAILPPTVWAISGTNVTLASSLGAGNTVVCTWATANSTPGACALSTVSSGASYVNGCNNTAGSGLNATVTCSGPTLSAGDLVAVFCRSSGNSATFTVTDTGVNTYTPGPFNSSSSPSISDAVAYSLGVAAGSPTFTCLANSPQNFLDIVVVQYHPGTLSAIDTAPTGNIVTGNTVWTSTSFSTSNGGLIIACGDPNFASGTTTPGLIGSTTATMRQTSNNGPSCEDTIPGSSQTGITAAMSSGSSGNWGGTVLAFK